MVNCFFVQNKLSVSAIVAFFSVLISCDSQVRRNSIPPSFADSTRQKVEMNFKKHYDQFGLNGSFVLYDQSAHKFVYYDEASCKRAYTPASTFKIFNSLIGLETGVIKDENFIMLWDGVKRPNHQWNKDQDLRTAFRNSTVWYYQELARRVGKKQMKYWLDKVCYGNADTSGGIDKFWLSGGLRISQQEQIEFLVKLQQNKLPFSQRSMDIVKKIMIREDTLGYVFRAKTGWGMEDKLHIGWFVGYIEKNNAAFFFANRIEMPDSILDDKRFMEARIEISQRILKELEVLD